MTAQQIFDALPTREELQYNLEEDVEVYEANPQSRCDTPESYAVFVSFLEKDLRIIASTTAEDFTEAALHPSMPRSIEDLLCSSANERVSEKTSPSETKVKQATATFHNLLACRVTLRHCGTAPR